MGLATTAAIIGGAVAVGGAFATAEEGRRAASAAGRGAQAQRAEALRQFRELSAIGERAEELAKASPQELNALTTAIEAQERGVGRQEELIRQIDPAIIEASQQALRLLRGEDARALRPLKARRDRARQQLQNQLREQLGPGAETSSAGLQALRQFDTETSQLEAQTQAGGLQLLTQTGAQLSAFRPDITRTTGGLGALSARRGDISARESQAAFSRADLLQSAGAPLIGAAGADFVAPQLRAQARGGLFSTLGGLGSTIAGAGFGNIFGGGDGNPPSGGGGNNQAKRR